MPRIRTLKPEFWGDEKLSLLTPIDRLVFLGLISMADDAGRLVDNVKSIDGFIFPSTDDSSGASLETLARMGRIVRYISSSGQALIQISGWSKHQKVDKPSKYVLPGAPTKTIVEEVSRDARESVARTDAAREDHGVSRPATKRSRKARETLARPSRSDLRPTTYDLGSTTTDHPPSEGARAPSANGAGDDSVRGGWPARISEALAARGVSVTPGRCGGLLKAAARRFGPDLVLEALTSYLDDGPSHYGLNPQFVTIEQFAKNPALWVAMIVPDTDTSVPLTEGEREAAMRLAMGVPS